MEKEDCLKIIKDALDEVFKEHGNDYLSGKGDTVPTTYELMKVISFHIHKVKHTSSQLYTIVL